MPVLKLFKFIQELVFWKVKVILEMTHQNNFDILRGQGAFRGEMTDWT